MNESLPLEVLLEALSYLNADELLKVRTVNRRYSEAATNDTDVWRTVAMRDLMLSDKLPRCRTWMDSYFCDTLLVYHATFCDERMRIEHHGTYTDKRSASCALFKDFIRYFSGEDMVIDKDGVYGYRTFDAWFRAANRQVEGVEAFIESLHQDKNIIDTHPLRSIYFEQLYTFFMDRLMTTGEISFDYEYTYKVTKSNIIYDKHVPPTRFG